MPPKKRYTGPGRGARNDSNSTHHLPARTTPRPDDHRDARGSAVPSASNRYTPPTKSARLRPGWHKAIGFALIIAGITVVVLNDVMRGSAVRLLPGGHTELYLILGIAIAASSMWWFGWFDREQ